MLMACFLGGEGSNKNYLCPFFKKDGPQTSKKSGFVQHEALSLAQADSY